jgi:hypothetical protein
MERNEKKFQTLKNGNCKTRTGEKILVFTPTLELRPVAFAVYSGYLPDRGTYQAVEDGDIILQNFWNSSTEIDCFHIYRINQSLNGSTKVSLTRYAELWSIIHKKHPWVSDWIEKSHTRTDCWIPSNIVDEKDYLCNVTKLSKAKFSIEKYGLPHEPNFFLFDKKEDINWKPVKLNFNPDTYELKEPDENSNYLEIWYGSKGNGTKADELSLCSKNAEKYIPGIVGWASYKFLIVVKSGVYTNNCGNEYGHSVDVYRVHNSNEYNKQ